MSAPTAKDAIEILEGQTTGLFKEFMEAPMGEDSAHANGVLLGMVESLVYLRHGVELNEAQFAAYMHEEAEAALNRYQNWITTGQEKP